jgi:pseudouridine synthase
MRINRYLADSGVASRRKAEEIIMSGRVKINNQVVTNLAVNVNEADIVLLDGKEVSPVESYEYYMLNKPRGYVSTSKDDRERKTVLDLINSKSRLYPVGRLDYNTEGLLIITNDGDLTQKLTHPKHNISKTYVAEIEGKIEEEILEKLKKGIVIEGVKLDPCQITRLGYNGKKTRLEIVIFEGRNREIRKMFEAFNKDVDFLKRTKVGDLKMTGLNRGEYRTLTAKEVKYLKSF